MADLPPFQSPITATYPDAVSGTEQAAGLVLSDESAVAKWLVRAAEDTAAAAQLGVGFACSTVTDSGVLISGQRPSEWLLIGCLLYTSDAADD